MERHTRRRESLAGVLFAAALLTGGLLTNAVPYSSSAAAVATVFEDSTTRMTVGGILVMLSAAPLLWFVACLHGRLETDGGGSHLASIVAIAGGVGAAVALVSAASLMGALDRTAVAGFLQPAGAAAAWDLYGALLGAALPVAMAVFVGATAMAARRGGWFSPAATWISGVLVAGLLALPVAWMFQGLALLWISVSMTRRPHTAGTATSRPRTA